MSCDREKENCVFPFGNLKTWKGHCVALIALWVVTLGGALAFTISNLTTSPELISNQLKETEKLCIETMATKIEKTAVVAGVIVSTALLVVITLQYRLSRHQLEENREHFSLASFQNAFFSLYDSKKLKCELSNALKKHENKVIDHISLTLGLLELIRLNLADGTILLENAQYYLELIFLLVETDDNADAFLRAYENFCVNKDLKFSDEIVAKIREYYWI